MANSDTHSLSTTSNAIKDSAEQRLLHGVAIPAHPLALDRQRRLDEDRQRRLSRYYLQAGAGGLAVGVHTTQFTIHEPSVGLYQPVLQLAVEEMDTYQQSAQHSLVRVAGIVGPTSQAVDEAALAASLGYDYGLVNLAGLGHLSSEQLVSHCREIGQVIGVFGFYLQAGVGGIDLPIDFWRGLCGLDCLKAIKVAAFDRYKTIDVVRAVAETGRDDVALYTGNDDNIVADLLTPFRVWAGDRIVERRFVGGLLGQWAVGTAAAVKLLERCREVVQRDAAVPADLLALGVQLTHFNAVVFDAANGFRGCIAGIHEVLRHQGLLEGTWCLSRDEQLSPGQADQIASLIEAYPDLFDARVDRPYAI